VQFEGLPSDEHSLINVDIIHPCTERHIAKYSAQKTLIVLETPEVYERVTMPHMESVGQTAIQWVYNILDKKKEVERLLFEDPDPELGFMLHPDLKWDQTQVPQTTTIKCAASSRERGTQCACTCSIVSTHAPTAALLQHCLLATLQCSASPTACTFRMLGTPCTYHQHCCLHAQMQ
jgi:m7GpppX diphosphatase